MAKTDYVIGRLEAVTDNLSENVNKITETLRALPCQANSEKIEEVLTWKKNCNGETSAKNIEKFKGSISLKNAILLILLTNGITLVISLVTNFFAIGTP